MTSVEVIFVCDCHKAVTFVRYHRGIDALLTVQCLVGL